MTAKLALEDGTIFTGRPLGAHGTTRGEVVFHTGLTGYQEILTDPSYCGQIVVMTFPLIGNYGLNPHDVESDRPRLAGFVVREPARRPSNPRATEDLETYLKRHGIIAIAGIDTRGLTRRVRDHGAMRGVISTEISDELELIALARTAPPMVGANLAAEVMRIDACGWEQPLLDGPTLVEPAGDIHVVVLDCGVKHNILRHLRSQGCRVTVVPGRFTAGQILALEPDGIVVGNGPGDPSAVQDVVRELGRLIGRVPVFGICLGHQLLSLALGARTYKLKFGHHGANQPVRNELTGRVEITSQNHGFAVEADSLRACGAQVTHVNLNDHSVEGFLHPDKQVLGIQYHPEASPGPHDAHYLFERFCTALRQRRRLDEILREPAAAR